MNDLIPIDDFEKEVAKSLGKESAKSLFGFIGSILDPPAKELGEILRDKMKYYRLKNQINIINKARILVGANQIKAIDPKLLGVIFDFGGLEENPDLQEKWASLLAKAAIKSSNVHSTMSTTYSEILRQLSAIEAKILDSLYYKNLVSHDTVTEKGRSMSSESLGFHAKGLNSLGDSIDFIMVRDNLTRLNLVKNIKVEITVKSTLIVTENLGLTTLGYYFVQAITPDEKTKKMEGLA